MDLYDLLGNTFIFYVVDVCTSQEALPITGIMQHLFSDSFISFYILFTKV
jgi:hypothetical protein